MVDDITIVSRDPYFEDIEWLYSTIYLGLFKWEKEKGARSFFEGLDMGANKIFEVSNMGLGLF